MKNKDEIETRIAELRKDRERLVNDLEKARAEAKEAIIAGRKPAATAAALAEQIAITDEALAELNDRLRGAAETQDRSNRRRRAETALDATAKRAKLAQAVDDALIALSGAWPAYQEALRKDLGTISAASGDVGPVERGLVANQQNDVLVRALIKAGGLSLARALGIDTAIRERHAITLAGAEERVAESLRVELLRVKADSPQPNISKQAQRELAEIKN